MEGAAINGSLTTEQFSFTSTESSSVITQHGVMWWSKRSVKVWQPGLSHEEYDRATSFFALFQ